MDDLLSAEEVAARLGIDPSRVRRMAVTYGIGRKIGLRVWVFSPDDVAALRIRSTGKRGRPRIHPEHATGAAPKDDAG